MNESQTSQNRTERFSSLRFGCFALIGFVAFTCSGCSASFSPRRATSTTTAYLRTIQHGDTTDHLAYMGSDAQFHYVFHSQLFGGGSYRVPVSTWHPKRTFPLNDGKPYVLVGSADLPIHK